MSKKKSSPARSRAKPATGSGKPARTRAAAAANPVRTKDVTAPPSPPKAAQASAPQGTPNALADPAQAEAGARRPFRRPQSLNFAGVGRNDICPCGSGKRFKNCHGH